MNTRIKLSSIWIVIIFSVLHALCCICCRSLGVEDARALTLLTVAMTFVLCYQKELRLYYTIASIIVVNVLAYLLGSALPKLLIPLLGGESMWVYTISTFVTTLILGLCFQAGIAAVIRFFGSESLDSTPPEYKQRWVVRINDRIVPVKTELIAYFFSEDKCNYLVTFDGSRYIVDSTMDGIQANLDPASFFRINRSCILSLASIDSAIVSAGRYTVQVRPALDMPNVVSRSRVDDFLAWMENKGEAA